MDENDIMFSKPTIITKKPKRNSRKSQLNESDTKVRYRFKFTEEEDQVLINNYEIYKNSESKYAALAMEVHA
jgi:hypothetical protein